MNERIKQLAELSKTPKTMMVDGVLQSVVTIDAERFAGLIVGECVQTLLDNTPDLFTNEVAEEDWDKGYDRAMRDCVHHIKEHFGFEE